MSIVILSGEKDNKQWTIYHDKYSTSYIVHITYYGKTVYKIPYMSIKSAKQAIKRYFN